MSPIRISRHTQTRTLFMTALIGCIILGILAYVGFQARFLIEGPLVSLTSDVATVQHDRQITLTGTARNITAITLNGRPIVTDEHGNFDELVVLENGYTIVRIAAHDRYGRTTTIERSFVYTANALSFAQ